jgi:tetratricopeptide (TPR) repeat protein
MSVPDQSQEYRYDVALSFAGEDRPYADKVAEGLQARDVSIFHHVHEVADTLGKDLTVHLHSVFSKQALFAVVFTSAHHARKALTSLELSSALERALKEPREYILRVRLDDTEIAGLRSTIAELDGRKQSPDEIADIIAQKVKATRGDAPAPPPPPPRRRRLGLALGGGALLAAAASLAAVFLAMPEWSGRLLLDLGQTSAGVRRLELARDRSLLSVEGHLELAKGERNLEATSAAITTLRHLVETPPLAAELERLPRAFKAEVYFRLGGLLLVEQRDSFTTLAESRGMSQQNLELGKKYLTLSLSLGDNDSLAVMAHLYLGFAASLASDGDDVLLDETGALVEIEEARLIIARDARLTSMWPLYHYWHGRTLIVLDRYGASKDELKGCLSRKETTPYIRDLCLVQLALATLLLSEGEDAGREATAYLDQIQDKDRAHRRLLALSFACLQSANIALGTDQFAERASGCERILNAAADKGEYGAEVHFLHGWLAFHKEDWSRALVHFMEALRRKPEHHVANQLTAETLLQLTRSAEAEPFAEKSAETNPSDLEAQLTLARIYITNGKPQRAVQAAERALEIDHDSLPAALLSVEALDKLTKPDARGAEEISLQEKLLSATKRALKLASTSLRQEEALVASSLREAEPTLLNNLAYAYAETGQNLDLGLQYARDAHAQKPGDPAILDTLGWLCALKCRDNPPAQEALCKEANAHLNLALRLRPASEAAETHYHLGELARFRANPALARRELLKALQINPSHLQAKKALDALP